MDNVYKLAKSQGEKAMKWYSTVRDCDDALFNACNTYNKLCPPPEEGCSRARGSSKAFVTYIETVSN
eukprot:5648383-Alexandrium_andersonii.AAC.1